MINAIFKSDEFTITIRVILINWRIEARNEALREPRQIKSSSIALKL